MNYFDFLNKKIELSKNAQPSQASEITPLEDSFDLTSLFGEQTTSSNTDENSIFNLATKEQLQGIDYNKIVSKEENTEETSETETEVTEEKAKENALINVLKDFFSFDAVKEEADTNGDGEISAEEAQTYVENLAAQDGDETTLSMSDFDAVIQAKNINLEEIATQLTQSAETTQETAPVEAPTVQAPAPTAQAQPTFAPSFNPASARSYSGYSPAPSTPVNPLDRMSIEELETEKATREAAVIEKQNAVNAVNNGSNEKVQAAVTEKNEAEKAYQNAVKNDDNIRRRTNKDFQKNIENINENQTKLDENAVKITDKEVEISNQEESIKTLTSESESLTSYLDRFNAQLTKLQESLNNVGTPTGKEEDKDKDAQINAKRAEISTKIAEKQREIQEKQNEINAKKNELQQAEKKLEELKKDLEKLNEEKATLEEAKTKLNEEKANIEAKILEDCTAETKASMEAYNTAVKNVETVKAAELQTAKAGLQEAQTAVQEINTKINQIKNKKVPVQELNTDNIPAEYKNQISVKTLANGTEVLTFGYTNYQGLNQEMQDKIAIFNEVAAEKGYTFVISDGYRSIEQSNKARALKGNMVAPGGQSPHNYGAGFDCGVYKKGGQVLSRAEWTEFTREVQSRTDNIKWGGDFKSKSYEVWHFELENWRDYRARA